MIKQIYRRPLSLVVLTIGAGIATGFFHASEAQEAEQMMEQKYNIL